MSNKYTLTRCLLSIGCILLIHSVALAQADTDPRTAPLPDYRTPDPDRALVISVFFHSPTDVEVIDVRVASTRTRSHTGDPPLLLVELIDRGGDVLTQHNVMHPLWEFDRGIDGRESKQELTTGPGTLLVPLSGSLDSVRISDQRLGEALLEEPVRDVVTEYCGDNPASTICDDDDRDGVINVNDACVATGTGAGVDPAGCSVVQLCPCEGPFDTSDFWKNHGEYIGCLESTGRNFRNAGFIDRNELGRIVSLARRGSCGRKPPGSH